MDTLYEMYESNKAKSSIKNNPIETKIELNETIRLGSTIFKPIEILGELPSGYRIYNIECKRDNGNIIYKQLHELHVIELNKRAINKTRKGDKHENST